MLAAMTGWQTSGPAPQRPPEQLPYAAALTEAPRPAMEPTWWSANRSTVWAWVGWLSAATVVVAGAAVLWQLLSHSSSPVDPYLGLIAPAGTGTGRVS